MRQPTTLPAQIVADTIIRTVELGVRITDAAVAGESTVVFCELLVDGPGRCPGCGHAGTYRDTVERRVTDVPVVGHPLELCVAVPRYRCLREGCDRQVFCHDTDRLAARGASTTRRCARFVLRRLMLDRTTVAAVARELGRCWDTVNTIAVAATQNLLLTAGPGRLDGVRVIGVDEHRWAHTRTAAADGFVTVITDLTAVVAGHGPARLLDMVPGRSAAAMKSWLEARDQTFRDRVEIVAMDGFGGYKTAATEALPDAVTVMDPFHVVALAGDKLDRCRQRAQQDTIGHRGRSGDPLYGVRRVLRTRLRLLTDKQRTRLETVFAAAEHTAVQMTWHFYQLIIAAYAHPDPKAGKDLLTRVINSLRTGLPGGLAELAQLGRTMHRRRADILAYSSIGPPTAPPKRSTAASKPCAATPWASAT